MEESLVKQDILLKICAIGSGKVGKSDILTRFSNGKVIKNHLTTLGVDVTTRKILIDETLVKLLLIVTTGRQSFKKLRPSYYKGASACIIFFTLKDRLTFIEIPSWIREFRSQVSDESIPISLIAITKESKFHKIINLIPKSVLSFVSMLLNLQSNRFSKKAQVTSEEVISLAQQFSINYHEINVSDPLNFEKCVIQLAREVLEKMVET